MAERYSQPLKSLYSILNLCQRVLLLFRLLSDVCSTVEFIIQENSDKSTGLNIEHHLVAIQDILIVQHLVEAFHDIVLAISHNEDFVVQLLRAHLVKDVPKLAVRELVHD